MSTTPDTHEAHGMSESHALDPHGAVHHEHVILPVSTLLGVLIVLLVFTVLTVAASRTEVFIAEALDISIPQWVNVSVAMSIAVIKALFVALFFMQLKYDNKLNAVVACTCLGALALFLGFSALDLRTRGSLNDWESMPIKAGGIGLGDNVPIVEKARLAYIEEHGIGKWEEEMAHHHAHHEDDHHSSAQKSRPQHGPTGLFQEVGGGHGGSHGAGH